jgi:hypothetical protein
MGKKVRNVEAVTDFADGTHFIRLHRDVVLPAAVCEAVRRHLAANRWEEAKALALEHAPADAHPEIELFFTSTALRLAADAAPVAEPAGVSASRAPEPALTATGTRA